MLIAASKSINIDEERKKEAADIIESGNFFLDVKNNTCEIMLSSGSLSLIHLDSYTYSCFASSHGIPCTCLSLAKTVTVPAFVPNHISCKDDSLNLTEVTGEEETVDEKRKKTNLTKLLHSSTFHNLVKFLWRKRRIY